MITLRPLKKTDNLALFAIYSNKKVTKPAGFLPYQFQFKLDEQMNEFLETHTAIIYENQLIGVITKDQLDKDTISLGIMIHEKYWGKGIGKSALNRYINELKDIHTIYADCISKNIASQKLLDSCGFIFKQDFKRKFPDFIDEKNCKLYIKNI